MQQQSKQLRLAAGQAVTAWWMLWVAWTGCRTAAIIFRLSRYLNIFMTLSTLKERSTRNDRTDLQGQQQQPRPVAC